MSTDQLQIERSAIEGTPRTALPPSGCYRVHTRTKPIGDYVAKNDTEAAIKAFDQGAVSGARAGSFLVLSHDGKWSLIMIRMRKDAA